MTDATVNTVSAQKTVLRVFVISRKECGVFVVEVDAHGSNMEPIEYNLTVCPICGLPIILHTPTGWAAHSAKYKEIMNTYDDDYELIIVEE